MTSRAPATSSVGELVSSDPWAQDAQDWLGQLRKGVTSSSKVYRRMNPNYRRRRLQTGEIAAAMIGHRERGGLK
jgi:hypothetical protein